MASSKTTKPSTNGVHINRIASVEPTSDASSKIVIPKPRIEVLSIPIIGTSPLLLHKWSEKAKRQMLDKQMKKATKAKDAKDPEADFNGARYISQDGWDGCPAVAFKSAMVGACRQCDGLPMTLAKRIFFVEVDGYTPDGDGLVRIVGEPRMHEAMVRLETGTADIRYRPIYHPWRATIQVRFNAGIVSAEQVVNLIQIAGLSEGVGEWRPSAPKSSTGIHGCWEIEEG
jgi:hypothetical protein